MKIANTNISKHLISCFRKVMSSNTMQIRDKKITVKKDALISEKKIFQANTIFATEINT